MAKKMGDISQIGRAIYRHSYISTITSNPRLFKPILQQLTMDLGKYDEVFYVTPLHPDEFLPNVHRVYSLENMKENLSTILKTARTNNCRVKYIKAIDTLKYFHEIE